MPKALKNTTIYGSIFYITFLSFVFCSYPSSKNYLEQRDERDKRPNYVQYSGLVCLLVKRNRNDAERGGEIEQLIPNTSRRKYGVADERIRRDESDRSIPSENLDEKTHALWYELPTVGKERFGFLKFQNSCFGPLADGDEVVPSVRLSFDDRDGRRRAVAAFRGGDEGTTNALFFSAYTRFVGRHDARERL